MKHITIAIDGPAGAGKSTIAKIIAKQKKIMYLDTGAMYRALALKMIMKGINPSSREDVLPLLHETDINVIHNKQGDQLIYLDTADVTSLIRTPEVSKAASAIAVIPEVRIKLVELQRAIANKNSLVMDGRDIGTYVLPDATFKFFLTASIEERAQRRFAEFKNKGINQDLNSIILDIKQRDANDTGRSFAPLKKAKDAILIDTSDKSIDEVVSQINSFLTME